MLKIIEEIGKKPIGKNNELRMFVTAECPLCKKHWELDKRYIKTYKSCGCIKKQSATDRGKNQRTEQSHLNFLYKNYRKSAKERNHLWSLDISNFSDIITSNCFYCNASPKIREGKTQQGKPFPTNGIDRMNNNIGYEISNVVPCCSLCNKMKSSLSKEEFLTQICKIYEQSSKVN